MPTHSLRPGGDRTRPLITFALANGWSIHRTEGGGFELRKPGLPSISNRSTIRHGSGHPSRSGWAATPLSRGRDG